MAERVPYRLSLDLGASSLGWAVLALDRKTGEATRIEATGVRIFEAGVEGDIEQGKDASRAVVRRQARQPRRQQWRRQHRKQKVFNLLQNFGLLPTSDPAAPRKAILDALDADLSARHVPVDDHDAAQKLAYRLRDMATTAPVQPFELGRALYHLAQRRGYLSNRKSQGGDDEEGQVVGAISEMQAKLNEAGLKLGAFFNRLEKPAEKRIRRRWLGREQYQDEFKRIREVQSRAFPAITDADWKRIHDAIFFQRPLKSQRHLIGRCDLEKDARGNGLKRCAMALPIAQEFRLLQKVNDLRVTIGDRVNAPLMPQEREKLLAALHEKGELSWSRIRTLLKLGKSAWFSLEEWDDKLIGHRTNAKMLAAFGPKWREFPKEQQDAIVLEVLHYRKPERLKQRAINVWSLSEEAAERLQNTRLEPDYSAHSKRAIERLVRGNADTLGMSAGVAYQTVRKALYPEEFETSKPRESLPPVLQWRKDIRNPAVIRALTELRKVVNELVGKYGRPAAVHIELAREIRNSRDKRKDIHKKNKQNETRRKKAVAEILKEVGTGYPRRRDVDKWLLADECNRECPYCGKAINMRQLMAGDAEFNIEHILPRRYLDDSYLNKTIACRTCNDAKGDRLPAAVFSGERLQRILQRVEEFQGSAAEIKLARFKMEKVDPDFVDRQLNDTRYSSRIAAAYLQLLFGGQRFDGSGKQIIVTPTGQLTGRVRANWRLNDLLGEPDNEKERSDHRHHAIDAAIVGFLDQGMIQRLAQAAEAAEQLHLRHFFDSVRLPWSSFKDDLADQLKRIWVSHRPTRTVAGPLHAETIYSRNFGTGAKPEFRVRKHLSKLTAREISGEQIVDPHVRLAVQQKFEELGRELPSKLWGDESNVANFPMLVGAKPGGKGSIIRKVRLRTDAKPRPVGEGARRRFYASGKDSNYAALIYARIDEGGSETRWEHEIVDRLTANRELSAHKHAEGEKVLIPRETPTRRFKFALCKNDMLLAHDENGIEQLYRVQKFSANEIQLCEHTKGTVEKRERTPWNRITSVDNLRKRKARPVHVSPAGDISTVDQPRP